MTSLLSLGKNELYRDERAQGGLSRLQECRARPSPVHGADPQPQTGAPFGGEVMPGPGPTSHPLGAGTLGGQVGWPGVAFSDTLHLRNDLPISPLSLACQSMTIKFLISK